jgi:hypothetical protein
MNKNVRTAGVRTIRIQDGKIAHGWDSRYAADFNRSYSPIRLAL